MSLGAEKSQPPEVYVVPGPQDLEATTLPLRCVRAAFYVLYDCWHFNIYEHDKFRAQLS